jgi:hypothetical protein
VTHCGNAQCTSGNVSTTADDPGGAFVGLGASIAIGIDGLPVISHDSPLRVTHCGNAACAAGNSSRTVSTSGIYSSIAIGADGLPVLSHWEGTLKVLRVTKCGTVSC